MARVSDIIDTKGSAVLEIEGSATVFEAVTKMVEGNVGSLLVTEEEARGHRHGARLSAQGDDRRS